MNRAIDCLCNLFTTESIRKNYLESEAAVSFAGVGRTENLRGYEPSQFIEELSAIGVQKILVTAIVTWSYWQQKAVELTSPGEVLELSQQYPSVVYGLYGVNPRTRMEGVAELTYLVRDRGFRGVHIHPHGFGYPPNHAYYYPFYARAAELEVPVVVSMGHTLDLMPMEHGRPYLLDDVALYFPKLRIVIAHTGWPWVEEAIALAAKHPNVFLGTSAYAPRYWKPEMVQFLSSRRGRDKVLWGTDWPLIRHSESLQQVDALGIPEESKRRLLYDNAAAVFGFTN